MLLIYKASVESGIVNLSRTLAQLLLEGKEHARPCGDSLGEFLHKLSTASYLLLNTFFRVDNLNKNSSKNVTVRHVT